MHTPFANYIRLSVDLQCLSFSLYRAQGYDCQKLTLTRELQEGSCINDQLLLSICMQTICVFWGNTYCGGRPTYSEQRLG